MARLSSSPVKNQYDAFWIDSQSLAEKIDQVFTPSQNMSYSYLDNQATTPMDPRVLGKMMPYMTQSYANCHSQHRQGRLMAEAVEEARNHVAKMINADQNEIVFTSGATESNNLAIKGVAKYHGEQKPHLVTSKIEHKCVLESFRALEADGFQTHYIEVDQEGRLKLDQLQDCMKTFKNKTAIVSVMGANNEIGTIQDLQKIGEIAHSGGAVFHSDCAQLIGKQQLDVRKHNIDLMSISGHKIYGPKGIGALFVNKRNRQQRVRLVPIISGGGQENNLRSGTLAVFLCVGFGEAARIINQELTKDIEKYTQLRKIILEELKDVPKAQINGSVQYHLPNNVNVSFIGVEGESLMLSVDDRVAVSAGSACTSQSLEPSHVLHAMGLPPETAHTSIRLGVGRFTTEQEVKDGMKAIKQEVIRLRQISALWEE